MSSLVRVVAAVAILLGFALPVSAEGEMPQITIVQSSVKGLLSDLEYIIKLAGEKGEEQWDTISETIEVFLEGVNREKPLRVDIITDEGIEYRISIPFDDFNDFIANIEAFGIEADKLEKDLYELGGELFADLGAAKPYMKVFKGYVIISFRKALLEKFDPTKGIDDLSKNYDLAIRVTNNEDGQDKRREFFQGLSEELLDGLEKEKGESDDDFVLKKRALETQLQEGERFFVEASKLVLGWNTDPPKNEGRLALHLAALAKTSLLESIEMLSTKPSYFQNIKKADDAILFGRLNHPLDDMRKKNFSDLIKLVRKAGTGKIEGSDSRNAEEKAKGAEGLGMFLDMLAAGIEAGVADGFVQVRETGGKRTLVGGIKSPDGNALVDVLKLYGAGKKSRKVSIEASKDGDVAFHSVSVPERYQDMFKNFFGDDTTIHFGTSKEAIWFATGDGAVDAIKAAIKEAAGDAEANKTFAELSIKVGPWIKFLDERRKKAAEENPPSKEEKDANEQRDKLRQMALDAFEKGGDTVELRIDRVDSHVEGVTKFGEGILRFLGMAIADFAESTLQ
ncbi:MAG: hypothetical protein CMJ78_00575 [Planctomycetaceae bacterium]|nr:hypothetical protein [Planctomycetaceae bacterium]